MTITAHEVAVAIVAASKEAGVDPGEVLQGPPRGSTVQLRHAVSRARAYAGRALDRVFNRPEITVSRPEIARMVGVAKPSWGAFFPSLDNRPLGWWDDEAFKRVVNAVMDAEEGVPVPPAPPPVPPPLKMGPLPPPKHVPAPVAKSSELGTLEPGGYRPAPGTYKREIESRAPRAPGRPRTGLDRFADRFLPRDDQAGGEDQLGRRAREQRQCKDMLAEAAANTAKLQSKLPPEPGGE